MKGVYKISLLSILFPILIYSQEVNKIDTLYFDLGIQYQETRIFLGADTLLVDIYKDKFNYYLKYSKRLNRKRLDSIKRAIKKRKSKMFKPCNQ